MLSTRKIMNVHTHILKAYIHLSLVTGLRAKYIFLHIFNMGIDKRATLPPLPPAHVTKIVKIYLYRLGMFICVDFRGLWAENLYLLSSE